MGEATTNRGDNTAERCDMADDIEFLTPEEAAKILRRSTSTLANWRWKGEGPPYRKTGRSVLYVKSEVIAWANAQYREHTSEDAEAAR